MFQFNITRLGLFIRRQAMLSFSNFWIAFGAIAGILILISLFYSTKGIVVNTDHGAAANLDSLKGLYLTVFYFAGLIFTSKIFSELHKPQKSFSLLTLPVSNLEKLLGAWLITSPGFIVLYMLFISLMVAISSFITGSTFSFSNLFDVATWHSIATYMVVQTIFFLGACTFKGSNFIKTLFSLFIIIVAFVIFIASFNFTISGFEHAILNSEQLNPAFKSFVEDTFVPVTHFFFWYILGPFLLLVSFFKLKERQV